MKFMKHSVLNLVMAGILMMIANGCSNAADGDQIVRFGVVADVQYAEKPDAGSRHYAASREALSRCVTDLSEKDPKFVIQLGDMIDGGPNAETQLQTVAGIYRQLPVPGYHTLGNHDFEGLDRADVMNTLGMEKSYYTFDAGVWRCVVLDTQDLAIQGGWTKDGQPYRQSEAMLAALKTARAENAEAYNGGIGDRQKRWLTSVLAKADAEGKKTLVFGHTPLMPAGEKHTLWNAGEIVELLEAHDTVKAYFCGHQHGGGYSQANGIHYVTFEAMVDAAADRGAWALVVLSQDRILIEGVGAVTSRTLLVDP